MKTFVASDIHFGHRNIIKYCPHRASQVWALTDEIPDKEVVQMNERIIENWNTVVSPSDNVYILGDVCMGIIENTSKLIGRLNGIKVLIKGSHDRTLTKLKNGGSFAGQYFHYICDYTEVTYEVDGAKHLLCLSHYPISHWNGMNKGSMMLHGHLHGSPSHIKGRIKDIGLDTNNLKPYLLDDVVRELSNVDVIREHH